MSKRAKNAHQKVPHGTAACWQQGYTQRGPRSKQQGFGRRFRLKPALYTNGSSYTNVTSRATQAMTKAHGRGYTNATCHTGGSSYTNVTC
jgi:hypothetical protein